MNYPELAKKARRRIIEMIHKAQSSHVGSNFSCTDVLTVLFEHADLSRDEILVKSWAAASYYYFMAQKGKMPIEDLEKFGEGKYTTILDHTPGLVKFATGAMGYNLPAAVGFALAKKLKGEKGKVYVLMSDGEMDIGTTWECALLAAHHKLDNLVVIVDRNGLQAMGPVKDTLDTGSLAEKFKAFGWEWVETDGHDHNNLANTFSIGISFLNESSPGKPIFINAKTIKGKGVSFMENENVWHYSHVSKETLDKALEELK